jgi:hypothetical protein
MIVIIIISKYIIIITCIVIIIIIIIIVIIIIFFMCAQDEFLAPEFLALVAAAKRESTSAESLLQHIQSLGNYVSHWSDCVFLAIYKHRMVIFVLLLLCLV